jgi:hypothetical protein
MSEGLLTYLDEEKVTSLAADLHAQPHFNYWLIEVVSPKVLQFINRKWAHHFKAAGAPMALRARRLAEVLPRPWLGAR